MPEMEQPRIVIDDGTDPSITRRIEVIERSIERNPEAFVTAFRELGAQATDGVIETGDMEKRIPTATRAPAKLIKEFLNNRYDLDSEFDEVTENILATDERHKELVDTVRSKKSYLVKKGQMATEMRVNYEADSARDDLRRYRFGAYLGRVAAFKTRESNLQSAV